LCHQEELSRARPQDDERDLVAGPGHVHEGDRVVDHDVNVQNSSEVVWKALCAIDPERDIQFVLGPVDTLDHAARRQDFGSKMGIDATRNGPKRALPVAGRTRSKWTSKQKSAWTCFGSNSAWAMRRKGKGLQPCPLAGANTLPVLIINAFHRQARPNLYLTCPS
jgi:hypothetical protein